MNVKPLRAHRGQMLIQRNNAYISKLLVNIKVLATFGLVLRSLKIRERCSSQNASVNRLQTERG